MSGSDPYLIPNTEILANIPDIRDPDLLLQFETNVTAIRLLQLQEKVVANIFNTDRLLAIHKHIFQDVFTWAGQIRTINIAKPGCFFFATPQNIRRCLDEVFIKLNAQTKTGMNISEFAESGAYYLGELNAIHPFREGNGRTQREFIRQLGVKQGVMIDWSRVSQKEMYQESEQNFLNGDTNGLRAILLSASRQTHSMRSQSQPSNPQINKPNEI